MPAQNLPSELPARRVAAGRGARAAMRVCLPGRGAPYTTTMAVLLVGAMVLLRWVGTPGLDVSGWASTDLVNLRSHPVGALVASIFVIGGNLPLDAVLFVAASCVLERRWGLLRAVVIPLVGHVIATLLTEGGERIEIWQHDLPNSAAWQLDVGVSYVAFAAAAAATAYPARRSARVLAVAALFGWAAQPFGGGFGGMTWWGHLLSILIGLLCRHWLPVPAASPGPSPASAPPDRAPDRPADRPRRAPRAGQRRLGATVLAGSATVGVLVIAVGAQLVPAVVAPLHRVGTACERTVASSCRVPPPHREAARRGGYSGAPQRALG